MSRKSKALTEIEAMIHKTRADLAQAEASRQAIAATLDILEQLHGRLAGPPEKVRSSKVKAKTKAALAAEGAVKQQFNTQAKEAFDKMREEVCLTVPIAH